MRNFRFFSLILALFITGFLMTTAKAQEEMPPEDDRPPIDQPRRPNLLQELNLSREQIQQIRRINQANRPLRQEAQFRLRQANHALDEAIYNDSPNQAEVQARMKEVQAAQAELIKQRTATEFAIRTVLTPEQLVKFRDLRQRFMRWMENRRQNSPDDGPPIGNPKPQNINRLRPKKPI